MSPPAVADITVDSPAESCDKIAMDRLKRDDSDFGSDEARRGDVSDAVRIAALEAEVQRLRSALDLRVDVSPHTDPLGALFQLANGLHERNRMIALRIREVFQQAGGAQFPADALAAADLRNVSRWLLDRTATGFLVEETDAARLKVSKKPPSDAHFVQLQFTGPSGQSVTRGLRTPAWTIPEGLLLSAPQDAPQPSHT